MSKKKFWACGIATIAFSVIYLYRQPPGSLGSHDVSKQTSVQQPYTNSTFTTGSAQKDGTAAPARGGVSVSPDTRPGEELLSGIDTPLDSFPETESRRSGSRSAARTFTLPAREKTFLKQEMILIPAGSFVMGVPANVAQGSDRMNMQHVAVTNSFWIDKYEVTNYMFLEFVVATGYQPTDDQHYLDHWDEGGVPDGQENKPVVRVSVADALAYAAWAGKRLPTQEEWEKAARGTDGRAYPWGNTWDASRTNPAFIFDDLEDADSHPDGVSPYGVFNMEGNAGEWTSTPTESSFPQVWNTFFVVRYKISAPGTLSMKPPTFRYPMVGFRCTKDAGP